MPQNAIEPADFSNEQMDTCRNVNLLCLFLLFLSLIGSFFVYFQEKNLVDIASAFTCIIAFVLIYLLNSYKNYEVANVGFYLMVNILTLIAVNYAGHSVETELMYVFLVLLVFFLFNKKNTRFICLLIVITRVSIYETNFNYEGIRFDDSSAHSTSYQPVFNALLWALIAFTLCLYFLQQARLRIQQVRLRKLQEQNTLFYQHMAHDTNTAYSSVASLCQHLYNATSAGKSLKNEITLVERLSEASDFCSYILSDFLDYTKYRNDLLTVNRYEEMDLGSEIEKRLGYYRHMLEEKAITVDLKIMDNLPGLVVSDRIKVNRIFMNLITNAIKNTPSGGVIKVCIGLKGKKWELTLINPTKQPPIESLNHLFVTYEGTQSPGENHGLGLPITKMLAETLEGDITASYTETLIRFTVTIPLIEYGYKNITGG